MGHTINMDKSSGLTVELNQSSLGLAVTELGRHLLVQKAGAEQALDSLDRDGAVAPRAGLGLGLVLRALGKTSCLLGFTSLLAELAQTVDSEDDQEQRNTHEQEVDASHDEATHVLGHGTVSLGIGGSQVGFARSITLLWRNIKFNWCIRRPSAEQLSMSSMHGSRNQEVFEYLNCKCITWRMTIK